MAGRTALLLCAALLLGGCWPFAGVVYEHQLDGPWILESIDGEPIQLHRDLGGGAATGDGLPDIVVRQAGADRRYIVLQSGDGLYYYLIRAQDEVRRGMPRENIKGPFEAARFESERSRLALPPFTWKNPRDF